MSHWAAVGCQPIECPVDGDIDASPFLGREHIIGPVVARHLVGGAGATAVATFACGCTLSESRRSGQQQHASDCRNCVEVGRHREVLSLVNRKKLVRCAKHDDNKRGRVGIAIGSIVILLIDGPGTVGLLVGEHGLDGGRIKLLPILAAELVHGLATSEKSVVIPVRRLAGNHGIVLVEWMRQEPIACSLRLLRMMKSRVGERQNAGAGHRSSAAWLSSRVDENPILLVETPFDKRDRIVDSLGWNLEAGVSRRP